MTGIRSIISGAPILPILQADTVEQGVAIAGAIEASGLRNIEVVRRTPVALDVVSAIRKNFPDMVVGLGTVMSPSDVDDAKQAGSQFIVTPALSSKLLEALLASELPFIPGTANPADVLLATEYGIKEMKFFPASLSGGAAMLQALGSVFSKVSFCPTGGISQQNMHEYLALPNVFAVGGSWMIPKGLVQAGDWQGVRSLCFEAIQAFDRKAA